MAADPTVLNASGVTSVVLKSGVTARVGSNVGFDGTDFVLADADAAAGGIQALFKAMNVLSGDGAASVAVCTAGTLFLPGATYTKGKKQYLSGTAGADTETIPAVTATLTTIQVVGRAVSTDTMVFDLNQRG